MKQRFVVIYRMLDGKGLMANYFYSKEEAEAVMGNLDDGERDTILLIDVTPGQLLTQALFNVLHKSMSLANEYLED